MKTDHLVWPEAARVKLAKLWNAGANARQCADILSPMVGRPLSRNSIIGMVHRMRNGGIEMAIKGPTKADLEAKALAKQPARIVNVEPEFDGWPRRDECAWPLGDPGTPSFRFCCAKRGADRRYCDAHYAIAFRTAPKPTGAPMVVGPRGK